VAVDVYLLGGANLMDIETAAWGVSVTEKISVWDETRSVVAMELREERDKYLRILLTQC
jgi:hypothetical protein